MSQNSDKPSDQVTPPSSVSNTRPPSDDGVDKTAPRDYFEQLAAVEQSILDGVITCW
jgi:hypothetical protein